MTEVQNNKEAITMSDQILKEILESQQLIIKTLQKHSFQLDELQKNQVRSDAKSDKLETRMETEVIDKISILFDGYSLRGDQIENLQKHMDERFDSIEIDTGYLVSRVSRLEKIAK